MFEDLGPLQHSILSLGGVHDKKAGTDPCIFTSARLRPIASCGQGRLRLERGHVVQSRGKDFSDSTCDPRQRFLSLETTNPKAGGGVEGGSSLLTRSHSHQAFLVSEAHIYFLFVYR